MNIVFLSGSRSTAAGGIFEVERTLALRLNRQHSANVEAAGLLDTGTERDQSAWGGTPVHCFRIVGPKQFGYSPELAKWLGQSQHDLLHLHNLWMYTSVLALNWYRRTNRPYIVSPHGMLDPWAVRNSGWKKFVAALFYERRMLRNAAVIHAFHEKDVNDIRAFGLKNPIAVIPNGVELPPVLANPETRKNVLLFLGRIHPKKGLSELIDAWKQIDTNERKDWKLVIAGWDDGGHLERLKKTVQLLGLESSVEFHGPVFGKAKQLLIESSSGFILPSFSEGLPMTVLEAWSYGLPVLMTEMCNLEDGFSVGAALRLEPNPASISESIRNFIALPEASRLQIGLNGRELVKQRFTWDTVSEQFIHVYRWMLAGGEKPEVVRTIS